MKNLLFILHMLLIVFNSAMFAQEEQFTCGFPELSEEEILKTPQSRPSIPNKVTIESDHFLIHYTRSDIHATTDDHANSVKNLAEQNWQKQCVELEWDTPPPDGIRGGNSKYDIYWAREQCSA